MTAITEWGLHDRSATFSFYLTAYRCKSRPDLAWSAAKQFQEHGSLRHSLLLKARRTATHD